MPALAHRHWRGQRPAQVGRRRTLVVVEAEQVDERGVIIARRDQLDRIPSRDLALLENPGVGARSLGVAKPPDPARFAHPIGEHRARDPGRGQLQQGRADLESVSRPWLLAQIGERQVLAKGAGASGLSSSSSHHA